MTTLKNINQCYGTDWKRGDIVAFTNEGAKAKYRLTGRCPSGQMHVYAIVLDTPRKLRVKLHPTCIKRVDEVGS